MSDRFDHHDHDTDVWPRPARTFDVVLCHSMLEVSHDPVLALEQMLRVLQPGGHIALASVAYSGMIRGGPHLELIERFFAVRERVWARLEPPADPRIGHRLPELLDRAGFTEIDVHAHYISYGTPDAVRAFGLARAADFDDPGYRDVALEHGFLTKAELADTKRAWAAWSASPAAFVAFPWCRAVGRKPNAS
ncbi:MAG: methyltransferase domain-containing protein [Acidimicrobiales bacterium]